MLRPSILLLMVSLSAANNNNLSPSSYVPPKFVAEPKDSYGFAGESLQLACQATGTPQPVYSWRKGDEELDMRKETRMKIENGYLTIESFEATDAGLYQCQVRVNIGSRELVLTSSVAVVTSAGNLYQYAQIKLSLRLESGEFFYFTQRCSP